MGVDQNVRMKLEIPEVPVNPTIGKIGVIWGYVGILQKKMETTINLGFRV